MYARTEVMYRVLIDYVPLSEFENRYSPIKSTNTLAIGPFIDMIACKGAITRAKKCWPLSHYYVPKDNKGLAGRVNSHYVAEITDIRFERCVPVWTEMTI